MKMLEHQQMVLSHVSNDKNLFIKELFKSLSWLDSIEQVLLVQWIKTNFNDIYKELINDKRIRFA